MIRSAAVKVPHYQATLTRLWKMAKPGIRLSLEPMHELVKRLGEPWKSFPSVLIAGTNGKGSTAATLSEILYRSGYKVGLYTSPHLASYRERIIIKDPSTSEVWNERAWCHNFFQLDETILQMVESFTQFEILTALAFLLFADQHVDIAILEVGLGGRLDATNVIEPNLSVITPIDKDHAEYLGDSLQAIAREKGGILRTKKTTLTFQHALAATETLRDHAQAIGSQLVEVVPGELQSISLEKQRFTFQEQKYEQGLLGAHQVVNASLAIEAARALRTQGFKIDEEAIRLGVRQACWPARCEVISRHPTLLIDGAHNPHGARALVQTLEALPLEKPRVLLLGVLEDKDSSGILRELLPWGDEIVLTRSSHPKAMLSEKLGSLLESLTPEKKFQLTQRVGEGCRVALSSLRNGGTLCVAGSLTTAGEARRLLHGRNFEF